METQKYYIYLSDGTFYEEATEEKVKIFFGINEKKIKQVVNKKAILGCYINTEKVFKQKKIKNVVKNLEIEEDVFIDEEEFYIY
jgi:hypothetical protein